MVGVLDKSEMFSTARPTPKVPVLLKSTTPEQGRLGVKIMSLEHNLDPGPCGGKALSSSKGS